MADDDVVLAPFWPLYDDLNCKEYVVPLVNPVITQGLETEADDRAVHVEPPSVEYSKFVSVENGLIATDTSPSPAVTEDTVGKPGLVEKLVELTVDSCAGSPYSVTV